MSLHVCPGEIFISDSRLAIFFFFFFFLKETDFLAFCLLCFDSGALLYVRPSFILVSWTKGAR